MNGRILFLACCILASPAAAPADGIAALQGFFQGLRSLEAAFHQTVRDETGRIVQESAGTLALQRPDRFRWDYVAPYRQVIVTDGRRLWIYDEDLEQVTVKDFAAIGDTPATLLSSDRPLEASFVLQDGGTGKGLSWVVLRPRRPDTGFARIRLGFAGNDLAVMTLTDSFDQTTEIRLDALRRNVAIDPRRFVFRPPPGVDVIDDTETVNEKP